MANQKFDPPSQAPIAVAKQQWRVHLKNLRQNIPLYRQEKASVQACQKLSAMSQHARFILSFASFGSEINLWPFNQKLCAEGRLVLPLVTAENEIAVFLVTDFDQLEPHRLGMLEPKNPLCKQIDLACIEIALIPGLGFDLENNHRLGYGQGCYDRLMDSAPPTMQTWGIGFSEQAVENLPYSKNDRSLNHIHLF